MTQIQNLSASQLRQIISDEPDLLLIDCREKYEWDTGHIPNAILLPITSFDINHPCLKDKDKKIAIYCRSGVRSLNLCYFLRENNYLKLFNLTDGIIEWKSLQLPLLNN